MKELTGSVIVFVRPGEKTPAMIWTTTSLVEDAEIAFAESGYTVIGHCLAADLPKLFAALPR